MAVSPTGLLFLLAIIFTGPVFYGVKALLNKRSTALSEADGSDESAVSSAEDDGEEKVDTMSYVLGLLGYAIGIGNVWRFPYLVGKYGGGAFVFAYLLLLFTCALPLFMLELGLGQWSQKFFIETYEMIHPRWKGLGFAQAIMMFFLTSYYNVLIAYAIIYAFASVQYPLPWITVRPDEYWQKNILNMYDDPRNASSLGPVNGTTVGALFGLYVLCFFSLAYGKQVLAKITWITVLSPLLLMIILVCRSVVLPGASEGIKFYLGKFDWHALRNFDLWATAAGQILFSLSPGLGAAITLTASSHNKNKDKDPYKIALLVAACNSGFSIFGGFAIFSILGEIAREDGISVAVVASRSGTGLAFITLAKGMTHFGAAANVMSVLLFSMLVLLGIDSTFAFLEVLLAVTKYMFKKLPNYQPSEPVVVAVMCVLCFLSGIIYTTRLGIELLDIIDHFVGTYVLLFANTYMGVIFNIDIGYDNWAKAVKDFTTGNHTTPEGRDVWPAPLWRCTMSLTAPLLAGVLLILGLAADVKDRYAEKTAPAALVTIGWVLFAFCIVCPVYSLLNKGEGTLLKKKAEITQSVNIELGGTQLG